MRLLALLLLLAQEGLPGVPPRMAVDEEPSAAACTFPLVLRGHPCAYEASSAPADPSDNAGAVLDAGREACASASHGDTGLRRECERAIADLGASERCALRSRLADGSGRLTHEAQDCAELLRQEISRTSRAATLSPGCCGCLAESRCSVDATQCKRELADLMPSATLRSCLSKSCSDVCSFAAPARSTPEEMPPSGPADDPRNPKKI
jgi:hypothetical protein